MSRLNSNVVAFAVLFPMFVGWTVTGLSAAEPVVQPSAPRKVAIATDKDIQQWVRQLGDDNFDVREAADKALIEAGGPAMAAVREATLIQDVEVRGRAAKIARQIEANAAKVMRDFGADVQTRKDGTVFVVDFRESKDCKLTDADLIQLLALPTLETLSLRGTKVSDEGLKYVGRRTSLTGLNLEGTLVSDDGLAHLSALIHLQGLGLGHTNIKGSGLVHLRTLPTLESVALAGNRISDAGLKLGIVGLKGLKYFSLIDTQVTENGLSHLTTLKKLTRLWLEGMHVTRAGLRHLVALPSLNELILLKTQLTDDGCSQLAQLKGLQRLLILDEPKVTLDGLKKLQDLPMLKHLSIKGVELTDTERKELSQALPKTSID